MYTSPKKSVQIQTLPLETKKMSTEFREKTKRSVSGGNYYSHVPVLPLRLADQQVADDPVVDVCRRYLSTTRPDESKSYSPLVSCLHSV